MLLSYKLQTWSPRRPVVLRSLVAATAAISLGLAGCGRSAPVDALADTSGDPDIAGVSVTSPDAVVATDPTSPDETVAPTSTPATVQQSQATYVVQPGDTLSGIAGTYGISLEALAEFNGIADMNTIAPGQELVIPPQTVEVTVVDAAETSTTSQP